MNQPTWDHAARDRLVRHAMDAWGNSVYLVALNQTRSVSDAQDVTQDVFVQLLRTDATFRDDEHLKAWLLRVCVNRCRELHRSAWFRRVEPVDYVDALAAEATEDEALRALVEHPVWAALRALPEKLRVVVQLFYVEECTTEEIAGILGCRPSTVRSRLHRARKLMKLDLEQEADHERCTDEGIPVTVEGRAPAR